jgi:hypothetical protein
MGLPKGIPRLYDEIAGLVGRMAQADKDKIEVLTGAIEDWRIRVGNRLDVAYGPLAQVDAVSAKPTDALLIAIPVDRRAALNEAAISALRQAGGMLSCLRAIELNLAKRPPHVGV